MDNLAKDKTSKLLVKYSIPAIIAMLVTCLYNTADRAFIGSMEVLEHMLFLVLELQCHCSH